MRAPWLLALALLIACDLPPERSTSERGPRVLVTEPLHGQEDVDRAAVLRVIFDRPLMPTDVHRGNVAVRSGERTVSIAPRFDPIDRVLMVTPAVPLDPSVVWRLEVENVRDLDGHAMGARFEIAFRTGERSVGEPTLPPPTFADVAPILTERCATQGCHAPPEPVLGLDLSNGEAVRATAIGIVAHQTRVGVIQDRPWYGTATLSGLARIDVVGGVGRPAHSYLVYKLIGDPHAWGSPMPPAAPLEPGELRLLSRWILAGAPTD